MSTLDIISQSDSGHFSFENIFSISECGYGSYHTPTRLVSGYQCVTRVTDTLLSVDYPDIIFFQVAIRGADDYLDCGGRIVELEKGVMIPIPTRFLDSAREKNIDLLKQALFAMNKAGIAPQAFRANQWRSIRGHELPTYSCSEDQPSGSITFAETEPSIYSVHKAIGDILVDTSKNQLSICLKDYLKKLE